MHWARTPLVPNFIHVHSSSMRVVRTCSWENWTNSNGIKGFLQSPGYKCVRWKLSYTSVFLWKQGWGEGSWGKRRLSDWILQWKLMHKMLTRNLRILQVKFGSISHKAMVFDKAMRMPTSLRCLESKNGWLPVKVSLSILKVRQEQSSPTLNLSPCCWKKNKQKVKLLVDKFQTELTVVLSVCELFWICTPAFVSALECHLIFSRGLHLNLFPYPNTSAGPVNHLSPAQHKSTFPSAHIGSYLPLESSNLSSSLFYQATPC